MKTNWPYERIYRELDARNPLHEGEVTGSESNSEAQALLSRLLAIDPATQQMLDDPEQATSRHAASRWRARHQRRVVAGVFGAAVTAVAAVLIVIALLPTTPPRSPVRSPAWRLVSSFGTQYAAVAGAGSTEAATCPTTSTCYVVTDSLVVEPGLDSGGAGPNHNEVPTPTGAEVTHDGGTSWHALDVPPDVDITTSFTCPGATTCLAVAHSLSSDLTGPRSPPMVLRTTDGGTTWTEASVSIPADPGPDPALVSGGQSSSLDQLICFSARTCIGFGTTPYGLAEGGSTGHTHVTQTVVLRTADGGVHWSLDDLPWVPTPSGAPAWSNAAAATFSCPDATTCIGLAGVWSAPSGSTGNQASALLEWRTEDGGATWTHSWVAQFSGTGGAGAHVTCADASHCLAFTGPATPTTRGPGYEMLSTSDGGASWVTSEPLAGTGVTVTSVSCQTADDCWIAGGHAQKGETPGGVIMVTTDGGSTWTTEPVPPTLSVQDVTCQSSACYAVAIKSGGGLTPFTMELLRN